MVAGVKTPTTERISPDCLKKVESARDTWVKRLVDLSRRNNLLYFRDLQIGTLELSPNGNGAVRDLIRSDSNGVALRRFVDSDDLVAISASLQKIADKALSNLEERGLETLFAAIGLATWPATDGGRPASAPVLLLPIKALRSGTGGDWLLKRVGELQINDVLLQALETEHGATLDADQLLREVLTEEDEDFEPQAVFERIERAVRKVRGFEIDPRCVLGNFSFQKLAIVRDLKQLLQSLAAHPIIAGLAGDATAREEARGSRSDPIATEFDNIQPDEEFLILNSDSTQQKAIIATLSGQNGVISGPPGTGKSQTIANLIAELAARGRRVLFVAEKRAALEVVLSRLRAVNLGHLCLDLHGADVSRKLVAQQLGESLDKLHDALQPNTEDLHAKFVDRRQHLNAHVRRLHLKRSPSNLSLYELYGQLLKLGPTISSSTRFSRQTLATINASSISVVVDAIAELATLADLLCECSLSAWNGAKLSTPAMVETALTAARALAYELWPTLRKLISDICAECAMPFPPTVAACERFLTLLRDVEATLQEWHEALYTSDLELLQRQLSVYRSPLAATWAFLTNRQFRDARRTVLGFSRNGKRSGRQLLTVVTNASAQVSEWKRTVGGASVPHAVKGVEPAQQAMAAFTERAAMLLKVFPKRHLNVLAVDECNRWFDALAADSVTPPKLLRVHELEVLVATHHLSDILGELRQRFEAAEDWPKIFMHAWLTSCLEDIRLQDPSTASFNGRTHDRIAAEFRALDEERLQMAVARVRRAHAERAVEAQNRFPDQRALVAKEGYKRARHLPLRHLVSAAPEVLLALRPCWMASPLSVSQLIPGDRPYFDLVIFDEGSQVLPEDAVTSLLRGRQAVVAGDSRQLPPTTFFASADVDDQDEQEVTGFESILDQMSAFLEPAWSLDWHYRSRDEALIAFSNRHIYRDRLVTFPGPGRVPAITHRLATFVPGQGGQEESAGREVEEVVSLILEHARTRPDESLGVIALGIKHADRISMALEQARRNETGLDGFFSTERTERFFIKNLERVQGDERDAVILSVGYGKDAAGKLPYRFGPLLQPGGERRLNVAITRARHRMTVVSSFTHEDMDPRRSSAEGVRLLRLYLEYAVSGGKSLDVTHSGSVPLNHFEQSVCDSLTAAGIQLIGQHGTSSYRLDLVALHPHKPGRLVLAIECDGATYHSAPTARDRDRLRQQHLEALGWRFHRIWSTDWFQHRDDELARAIHAFDKAVESVDQQDNGQGVLSSSSRKQKHAPSHDLQHDTKRGRRPNVRPGGEIDEYSAVELAALVRWIQSDGRLRTDAEIQSEVVKELGFSRRGRRIADAIRRAIVQVKSQSV